MSSNFWNEIYSSGEGAFVLGGDCALDAALKFFVSIDGARVLDLGCGDGASSLSFARRGASVVSVDISRVAVEKLSEICRVKRIGGITPVHCSALEINKLGKFDFVFGSMILHHLEPFSVFADVLRSCVAPSGKAFFYENNAYSDLLIWCRKNLTGRWGIPKNSDDEEFPLQPREVRELAQRFQVQIVYPELFFFRLASAYLMKGRADKWANLLDSFCYRFEHLRKYSYRQYLLLS
jgi:2-polyprenyl-3-methyl-5-hydroxy-6-metoxy-1,4-benzoquinol methylase